MRFQFSHAILASLTLHLALAGGLSWVSAGRAQRFGSDHSFIVAVTAISEETQSEDNGGTALQKTKPPQEVQNQTAPVQKHAKQSTQTTQSERANPQSGDGRTAAVAFSGQATDSGDGGNGGGERARILRAPRPEYPFRARQAGFEGKVTLGVTIAADGQVEEVKILESSGRDDCDDVARQTLQKQWQFAPAIINGEPVRSTERVVVRFQLIGR